MEALTNLWQTQPYAVGAAVVIVGLTAAWKLKKKKLVDGRVPMKPTKEDPKEVVIFAFGRWDMGPSASPGCLKLETFCRLARIPYRYDIDASKSGPTERWPYLSHGGKYVCDSNTCMEYLSKNFQPCAGDVHLTAKDRALGDMMVRMLDQGVYYHMLRYRWIDNFPILKKKFRFPGLPSVVVNLLMGKLRTGILESLNQQGTGDRSDAEYLGDLLQDVKALEQWMPVDGCFFGNSKKPTSYDATLYAHLHNLTSFNPQEHGGPAPAEFVAYIRKSTRIQSYLKTVEHEAWPDFVEICQEKRNRQCYDTVENIKRK